MTDLIIPARFNGPARSGNGGFSAGSLAERVPGAGQRTVEVTLKLPPPLDTVMRVATDGDLTVLTHDGATVAEAKVVADDLEAVDAVAPDAAADAMLRYPGLRSHPFPTCYGCGPDREEGDGLRIFPGPVPGRADTVASLWVPDGSLAVSTDLVDEGLERVGVATTWAALDCVGGWSSDLENRPLVLGQIAVRIGSRPRAGTAYVVVGRHLRTEGRKTWTASALFDADGAMLAGARHIWIAVDWAAA